MVEVLGFPFWRWDLDVHPLDCCRVFVFFGVVLEMIFVFVGYSRRPCAVLAVVWWSYMVVVCRCEPLMRRMSSANPRLERFASWSCSASATPCSSVFQFSCSGFSICLKRSELNISVLSGSPSFVPRSGEGFLQSLCCLGSCTVLFLNSRQNRFNNRNLEDNCVCRFQVDDEFVHPSDLDDSFFSLLVLNDRCGDLFNVLTSNYHDTFCAAACGGPPSHADTSLQGFTQQNSFDR